MEFFSALYFHFINLHPLKTATAKSYTHTHHFLKPHVNARTRVSPQKSYPAYPGKLNYKIASITPGLYQSILFSLDCQIQVKFVEK